ncbi:hypothetical protein CgunFtcFv8_014082 [Champsocephalus gunnari]|uniref:Apoptosis facilitator Bcl-2-like protein 14 n=1 Tax=Champsocephalus gunnari TaxID=52237 RepID=A0AAN8E5S3_CHAGU|nr:hypothetical protein CgunFtcFv8_014082 [Champsocephalus gunnari]
MSLSTMETQTEKQRPHNGQLIYVPHKDTIRLLEAYVQRSLSLNDGTLGHRRAEKKEKWVTMPRKLRRHSSDPSSYLVDGLKDDGEIGTFYPAETLAVEPEKPQKEIEKPTKKSKKNKKPSFWKSFLGLFSRKNNQDNDEEDSPPEIPEASDTVNPQPANYSIESFVSVKPTQLYYEKVSEELQKIIHEVQDKEEVKPLSDEEVINRIIALTKEEGDAIDDKLKDNPTLSSFFQGMSYSSFQKLADAYLETEALPSHNPPTVLPTAPELVKLAFTLDFTARIVGLSKQNIGHITGLGSRYLQDRFEYQQACSDHPVSDYDD